LKAMLAQTGAAFCELTWPGLVISVAPVRGRAGVASEPRPGAASARQPRALAAAPDRAQAQRVRPQPPAGPPLIRGSAALAAPEAAIELLLRPVPPAMVAVSKAAGGQPTRSRGAPAAAAKAADRLTEQIRDTYQQCRLLPRDCRPAQQLSDQTTQQPKQPAK